jgi:tetratricopeptide (TPR) repeat protein
MKRITFMLLLLAAFTVQAQKQVKPNVNKIKTLWQEGKYAEAKQMADLATTYEKTKDDGNTWYYRGLVYTTIDTIGNEQVKALDPNAFNVAMESFAKADAMAGKTEYSITDLTNGVNVVTKPQQMEELSNFYLNKAIKFSSEDPKACLEMVNRTRQVFEKQLKTYVNDTLAYYIGALVSAQEQLYDQAIEYSDLYLNKGGKSREVYVTLYQIYTSEEKKDTEKALSIIRTAKAALPNDVTFPKIEIEMLLNENRTDEARTGLEEAIKKEPNDKLLHYYLGYVNYKLEKYLDARKNFENALAIDPQFFDAQIQLANTYLVEVDKVSKTLNNTGNSPADSKKRSALVQERVKQAEIALPHLEKAEKMKATDKEAEIDLYTKLSLIYYYVADDKNTARVKKKLKDLGVED